MSPDGVHSRPRDLVGAAELGVLPAACRDEPSRRRRARQARVEGFVSALDAVRANARRHSGARSRARSRVRDPERSRASPLEPVPAMQGRGDDERRASAVITPTASSRPIRGRARAAMDARKARAARPSRCIVLHARRRRLSSTAPSRTVLGVVHSCARGVATAPRRGRRLVLSHARSAERPGPATAGSRRRAGLDPPEPAATLTASCLA